MQRGLLFEVARVSAFGSVLYMPCIGTVRVQLAEAREGDALQVVQAEPRPSSPDGVDEFLDDFWHRVWGTSFVPGESAMWLWEGTDPQTWLLSATDSSATTEVIGVGSLVEVIQFPVHDDINVEQLSEWGFVSCDQSIVVGTVRGSTGSEAAVYGISTDLVVRSTADRKPIMVRAFSPLGTGENLSMAVANALIISCGRPIFRAHADEEGEETDQLAIPLIPILFAVGCVIAIAVCIEDVEEQFNHCLDQCDDCYESGDGYLGNCYNCCHDKRNDDHGNCILTCGTNQHDSDYHWCYCTLEGPGAK